MSTFSTTINFDNKKLTNSIFMSFTAFRIVLIESLVKYESYRALGRSTARITMPSLLSLRIVRNQIQNTLVQGTLRTGKFDHITPALKELYWLPIEHRITFKLAALTYNIKKYVNLQI